MNPQKPSAPPRNGAGSLEATPATSRPQRARPVDAGARLVDVDGAAAYLGISRRSVFRLLELCELHAVRLRGVRALRLDVRDLEALVANGKAS